MPLDIDNLLERINPYHSQGEVTNSDYIMLFLFFSAMPILGWLLQTWFDDMARGRPITKDHPDYDKYFVNEAKAADQGKKNK
eukprot:SAG31_NODE_1057_length_10129_cov_29.441376_3_plen_82_part_00